MGMQNCHNISYTFRTTFRTFRTNTLHRAGEFYCLCYTIEDMLQYEPYVAIVMSIGICEQYPLPCKLGLL